MRSSLNCSIMEFGAKNLAMPHHISLLNSLESLADYRERSRNRFVPYRDASEEELVCPKPHRALAGVHLTHPEGVHAKPLRRLRGASSLPIEGEAGHEILDILFSKVNSGDGSPNAFFHGSPPCRASNPVIHDVHFTQERAVPSPVITPQKSSYGSPVIGGNSSSKGNSSAKSSYCSSACGSKPFVRIEGFASATSDSNRGVPAYA